MADDGKTISYRDAGVDIDAGSRLVERIGPLVSATTRSGSMGSLGGFGALFDPKAAGFTDPILVAATDGVGTKLKIAIESGRHETIGIDLVAMCVNDIVVQGAEPLFFLDYFATARLDVDIAASVVAGIAEGCRLAGCALVGGETAEMPGLYGGGDYDLAGFCVGAVERGQTLPRHDIREGDVLLGLVSSGLHSNGYSLARRVAQKTRIAWGEPAPFDRTRSAAEALLEPTRIYVKTCLAAIRDTGSVKALAHITGGGLTENLPRVLPAELSAAIDLGAIPVPEVFSWLAKEGPVAETEMLRTFNCGIGMVIVADASATQAVRERLEAHGETVVELGRLTPRQSESVVYSGRLGV